MSKLLGQKGFSVCQAYVKTLQSGFRVGHSTETAVLRVLSDKLESFDVGEVTSLVLLDLSAAFDNIDHDIICHRLQTTIGMSGSVCHRLVLVARIVDGRCHLRPS